MSRRRHRARLGPASLAGLAGLVLACGSGPKLPVPTVEYSGCWTVAMPGPVCALYPTDRKRAESLVRLWVKADPGTTVEIRAGDRLLKATGKEGQGGLLFQLAVPLENSRLTVQLRQPDGTRGPPWLLSLIPAEIPGWWTEAVDRARNNEAKEARRRLIQKTVPQNQRGLLLWTLAALARQEGNDEDAATYLSQGITVDHDLGVLSREWDERGMLAWIDINHNRFADARRILPAQPLRAGAPAGVQYRKAYYLGLLANRVGDYRSALGQLRRAADLAERVGDSKLRWKAEQLLAQSLQSVGRSAEAAELFQRLRSDPAVESPCDLGDLLINQAWSWLLAREGGEKAGDPLPLLQEAQDVYDRQGCRPGQRLNGRLNLVLAHQQAGRWADVRRTLQEIQPLASAASLSQRLWWLDLEGREAIEDNEAARALRLYRELAEIAGHADSLEGAFRAAVGRAHARIALGERVAAIEDLAVADHLIDEQTWLIPASEGRDTFLAQREEATRLYLELLLKSGQRQRAFVLARRARSRLLRQLKVRDRLTQLTPAEQRRWEEALSKYWASRDAVDRQAAAEWQIPEDRLTRARKDRSAELARVRQDLDAAIAAFGAPGRQSEGSLSSARPGEVILIYHPLPQGWVGFAAHSGGIEVTTFTLPPGELVRFRRGLSNEALSRILLAPFRSVLARAGRVRVLASGPLRSIDFHALPLSGEPLLARHAVAYSLDLPAPSSAGPPERLAALLVADPEGNLPAARQEAETVGAAIHGWGQGWSLTRLNGSDAGAGDVLQALPGASLFHFAGHGSFAGFAGWDSALRLADGSRLTLSDLLALRRVPSWVVLSSCDAGLSSALAPGEGIGVAQAFLLAGAQAVIAATRPVDDRTARDLIGELYRGWQPGEDLARQLQRAQLACLRRDPAADWASFRLFEP